MKFHSALATCIFRYQADRIQGFQITSTFSVLYPESTFSWPSAFRASSTAIFQMNHKQGRKKIGLDFLYIFLEATVFKEKYGY